jgi:hypothetical protein
VLRIKVYPFLEEKKTMSRRGKRTGNRRTLGFYLAVAYGCNLTSDCVALVGGPLSECINSTCSSSTSINTNPVASGCLANLLPGWTTLRTCNSEDPVGSPLCRASSFTYAEVRIFGGNWDSELFNAWLLQILLSELLGVPATVEMGMFDSRMSFYNADDTFNIPPTFPRDAALTAALALGDCRLANRQEGGYQPCAHVQPETWDAEAQEVTQLVFNGTIEPAQGLGVLGQEAWFITRFTLENDPSLGNYFGLKGEEHRVKLAKTFLRPTTWKDYCEQVSANNCTSDDGVAKRPPTTDEYQSMFGEGAYTGHFRATAANDCVTYPTNCTGHIADYPCGWTSYLEAQAYYIPIYLKSNGPEPGSGGYTYSQLTGIIRAANATRSNLMIFWWQPEPLFQSLIGTDAELIKVTLPTKTQQCIDARQDTPDMCSPNLLTRVGKPAGACDESSKPLQKLISTSLELLAKDPSAPTATWSPAHDAVRLYQISEYQLDVIFSYTRNASSPRETICQWAVDNMDFLRSFVPPTYPRIAKEYEIGSLPYVSMSFGALACSLVLATAFQVYKKRNRPAIKHAQIEFLWLLLCGAFTISLGAIVTGYAPPTNQTCIASAWLVNLGYTLELIPLIIKVAAINRLMVAARQMRRVMLTRQKLFGAVAVIFTLVLVFLVLWTVLDAPSNASEYILTQDKNKQGETIVGLSYYCTSNSRVWQFVAVGWNTVLLLCTSVLAFQTRKLRSDFNETQTLAFMIYSHFMFVILRAATLFLSMKETSLNQIRSLIYSVDTITTILIYFVPKLTTRSLIRDESTSRDGGRATHVRSLISRWMTSIVLYNDEHDEQIVFTDDSEGSARHARDQDTPGIVDDDKNALNHPADSSVDDQQQPSGTASEQTSATASERTN